MMNKIIQNHFDKAFVEYTSGIHYETLIEAKNKYFSITGRINDEDEDYEIRMDSFNDWYVFQFISSRKTRTVIKDYLINNQIDESVSKSLLNVNHSLFEFTGENRRREVVLNDLLHDKKYILATEHTHLGFLKKDIFVGRMISFEKFNYLMKGMCIIPVKVKSILKKQCKKIRKAKDPSLELDYLLKIEALKTKWNQYGHIDPVKIFVF